jgi:hypothetical protein
MNLIEVASYANMSKDATELGINRIIKYIGEKLMNVDVKLYRVRTLLWNCRVWDSWYVEIILWGSSSTNML